MTGHRPFRELTSKFSRERRARVAERVAKLKSPEYVGANCPNAR
jgi:hypothetical protein